MSNATNHFTVTCSNGRTFQAKCRNTMGGFSNMHQRIAKELGLASGMDLRIGNTWGEGMNACCKIRTTGELVVITLN